MHIRFLMHDVYSTTPGGVLTATYNLASELSQRHQVEIVSALRTEDTALRPWPEHLPVRVLSDARRRRLGAWPRSLVLPRPESPQGTSELAYVEQPHMNVALARLGRKGALKVGQEHRPWVSRAPKRQEAARAFYPGLDAVVTLTERDARRYRRFLDASTQVEAIPNAAPESDRPPAACESHVVVAAAKSLGHGKGLDRLLVAWKQVVQRCPGWELRIFGYGPRLEDLERQVHDLGLGGSVRLMGYTKNLHDEMAAASVFVLSSRWEGYPMVLLEAMACGLPVVAFDCPTGPREIVRHEVDGLLVPNGDLDGLADALCSLMEAGADTRRQWGGAGRARCREERTQADIALRWESLLERLDGRRG
jgi:glycosyltransferase involved in cell wall biosynthesis